VRLRRRWRCAHVIIFLLLPRLVWVRQVCSGIQYVFSAAVNWEGFYSCPSNLVIAGGDYDQFFPQ
jgi:hypothetical protein